MAKKVETQVLKKFTSSTSSQSILLEEYRALHSDYIQQRSEGVTRMNFFITAMSVLLGGVLVFTSSNNVTMTSYFRLIWLVALIILITLGIGVYSFLIQRHINTDRDMRGMARIRKYFVKLDPGLENFFLNGTHDIPSRYLIARGSGMRRSTEIIIGFLIGIAAAILSSYLSREIDIMIGVSFAILTATFLEFFARRKLGKVLRDAQEVEKINIDVIAK